jgi:motility quorum-sensing regulator/GCU-specific mRNA interferase toxin
MEKNTPHHSLDEVKSLVQAGAVKITLTAVRDAFALGFEYQDILNTVLSLSRNDFYKSMTSYSDHRLWQDVYHPNTEVGKVYLKLTVKERTLILSFKEL